MCGIAGILGVRREIAEPALAAMLAAIPHRGPDGHAMAFFSPAANGTSSSGATPIGLAHARLAIIEPTPSGLQPMVDESGAIITFNGEIYNYRQLQRELEAAGRPCKTKTDTEVILKGYATKGIESAHGLRGMFAFALLDPKKRLAWLCRDRLGIKPLYVYYPKGGGLLFASEIRQLLAAGEELVPRRVSPAAIESFLAQGMVCGFDALIDGVTMLGPGESLVVDWEGRPQKQVKYWQLAFAEESSCTRERAVADLTTTLREAVDCHMIADVPLGVFLSSGVDSNAVAAVASGVSRDPVHTIAIGFDQRRFDESAEAEESAHVLGTMHTTQSLHVGEMLGDIDRVFAAMDQPTVDGFNTYFVSRAARNAGLTVALSGVGGDELFGGYASFRDVPRARLLRKVTDRLRMNRALALAGRVASSRRGGVKLEELAHRPADLLALYMLRRELVLPAERRALMDLPHEADPSSGLEQSILRALRDGMPSDPRNAISSFELRSYMRDMLLRDADVFSMANSLELRVPLLDHRLVEIACSLPGRWKRPDPRPKPLLIDAVGSRLPARVPHRKKRGFTFPWEAWIRGALKEKARASIHAEDVWKRLGVNPGAASKLWDRFGAQDPRCGAPQMLALWVMSDFAARHRLYA